MKHKSKVVNFDLGGNEISPIKTDKDTGKKVAKIYQHNRSRTSNIKRN